MARTIFDATSRRRLLDRIARLRPDSQRRWGTMNASQMMCHLEDSVRCAVGITPARPRRSFLSNRLVRWLAIYVLPWPKGRTKTVKEMLVTQPGEFEEDRRRLQIMLEQAAALNASGEWSPHPAFGRLTGSEYGALIHRHFDYHLRQFGV